MSRPCRRHFMFAHQGNSLFSSDFPVRRTFQSHVGYRSRHQHKSGKRSSRMSQRACHVRFSPTFCLVSSQSRCKCRRSSRFIPPSSNCTLREQPLLLPSQFLLVGGWLVATHLATHSLSQGVSTKVWAYISSCCS